MLRNHGIHRATSPIMLASRATDGANIWSLIKECKPHDENSMYCNMVQEDHFRDTCVVAELDGKIAGMISGDVLPYDNDTFFVWQVPVSEAARGPRAP